jgi:hypothetical protein
MAGIGIKGENLPKDCKLIFHFFREFPSCGIDQQTQML